MAVSQVRELTLIALTLGTVACSDGLGTSAGQVSLQVATHPAMSTSGMVVAAAPPIASDGSITLGSDVLVLTSVKLVAKKLELRATGTTACDSTAGSECGEIETGPILIDLPLTAGAHPEVTAAVVPGTYDRFSLEIHHLSDDTADVAFRAAHPEMGRNSIVVQGTFNGTPFTYSTELDVEQESAISPAVTVDGNTGISLTLMVDVGGWFVNTAGTALLDPGLAATDSNVGGTIEENIKASFHAFEDSNHDGIEDH